jgi:hypothetical protein
MVRDARSSASGTKRQPERFSMAISGTTETRRPAADHAQDAAELAALEYDPRIELGRPEDSRYESVARHGRGAKHLRRASAAADRARTNPSRTRA